MKIRNLIDEREVQLIGKLEEIKHSKKKQLEIQKDDMKFGIENIKGVISFSQQLITNGNSIELLINKKPIISRFNTLSSIQFNTTTIENSDIEFSTINQESLFNSISSFGSIITNNTCPEKCKIEGIEELKNILIDKLVSFTITSFSEDNKKIEKGGDVFKVEINGPSVIQVISFLN